MKYEILEECLLFNKYRVLKLDRDLNCCAKPRCLINGKIYETEYIHYHTISGDTPLNYIAIKTTESFLGSTVEFI